MTRGQRTIHPAEIKIRRRCQTLRDKGEGKSDHLGRKRPLFPNHGPLSRRDCLTLHFAQQAADKVPYRWMRCPSTVENPGFPTGRLRGKSAWRTFSTARFIAMLATMLVMDGGEMGSCAGSAQRSHPLEAFLLDRP
jgi:hypothetical protein